MKFSKYITLICSAFMLILFSSCSSETPNRENKASNSQNEEKKAEYRKITVEKAKEMIDNDENVIIIDVRTETEYKEKHIPNAILIPNQTINNEPPSQLVDKNAVILVYCRSGSRSKAASKKLVEMGYTNIYDFGGIIDWSYETISGN